MDESDIIPAPEPSLSASAKRLETEVDGLSVLLEDKRMRALNLTTKKRILELLMVRAPSSPRLSTPS